MNFIEVSPNEYEKLQLLGFKRIDSTLGPRMIRGNGFSEILISKTNNDEFEYDYSDVNLTRHCKVYKTFYGLHKKLRLTKGK